MAISRRSRILKQVATDRMIGFVVFAILLGILFCYPEVEGGAVTVFKTKPIYIGQKTLELLMSPFLIALLISFIEKNRLSRFDSEKL